MTRVFIGGSRHVSRLDAQIRERIDNILGKEFPILIGDANGADKAVQDYLFDKRYADVEVFCSDGACRNNIGAWAVRSVPASAREKTAEFYSAKDRAMAEEATVGLMVWDGRSVGTLMNVFRLLKLGKKAVVYVVPRKEFVEFRDLRQWDDFIARSEPGLRRKVEQRATIDAAAEAS